MFLADSEIVENILCQGKKIRQQLKTVQPGQTLKIGDALIAADRPLVIKKGGRTTEVADDEYTLNRLTGMCAAFSAKQNTGYSPRSAMAVSLGLEVARDRVLYYSATPGAEHLPEVFTYHSLLCAIKQLESGRVNKENIARIAAIKNNTGKTLAELLKESKAFLSNKLEKFGTGGSRGIAELEKALKVVRSLSGGR